TVRNVTAVDDTLRLSSWDRIVLVGGGPLIDAAKIVAARHGQATESVGGELLQRASQALARFRAQRATRWVNTDLRALVLEPGFIWLLFLQGLWRRLTNAAAAPARGRAIIVVGDRFTADVVERLQGEMRPIIVAGATQ